MIFPPNSTISVYGDLQQPLIFLRKANVGPAEHFFYHVVVVPAPSVCSPPPVTVSEQC